MLTKKQRQVLDFLINYFKENQYAPSLDEIRSRFKLASVSTSHYYIKKLQDEGYLQKTLNQHRSIDVIEYDIAIHETPKKNDFFSVPVLGGASAGPATMFAEENISGYLKVSRKEIGKKDGVFALRVKGDSMNKAKIGNRNIEEGDFAVIDPSYKSPRNGDYVLLIIDGCASLKKFERNTKTGEVMLISESTNPKHKPIFISSKDDFMVNGKIIAVVKK